VDLARPFKVVTPTVDGDVLAVLANATASFTGRQVSQLVGLHSEKGTRNALQRLNEQGIVIRERAGRADLYSLNRNHLAAPHIEALARMRVELLDRIRATFESWVVPPTFAALFGSAARGDMDVESDIDLLVVRPQALDSEDSDWWDDLTALTKSVTDWTGNDTRPLELSEGEVRRGVAGRQRVLDDIRNEGVVVYGPLNYLATGGQRKVRS
jgi:predicted nucleotidyltransferase